MKWSADNGMMNLSEMASQKVQDQGEQFQKKWGLRAVAAMTKDEAQRRQAFYEPLISIN